MATSVTVNRGASAAGSFLRAGKPFACIISSSAADASQCRCGAASRHTIPVVVRVVLNPACCAARPDFLIHSMSLEARELRCGALSRYVAWQSDQV
jgi:hypothetical protein